MAWIFQFIYMHFTLTLCNGFNLLVQPGPLGDFFWNWSREKSGEQVVHFSIQIVTSRDFHVNNKETRQLVYWILGKLVSCIVFKCLKIWYRMDELLLWFSYKSWVKKLNNGKCLYLFTCKPRYSVCSYYCIRGHISERCQQSPSSYDCYWLSKAINVFINIQWI